MEKFPDEDMPGGDPTEFDETGRPIFALELATIFISMAASSKVVIRHEAQWQFPILMDHARKEGWDPITNNPAYNALDDYIRSLERFHDPPIERKIGGFKPDTDHTFPNLVEGRWFELDNIETTLTTREDLMKVYYSDFFPGGSIPALNIGEAIERPSAPLSGDLPLPPGKKTELGPGTSDEVSALQTKGTAYLARILTDPVHDASNGNKLIVVGSLVENPHNLGGLSRVSEIFGASALTVQNQNVLRNNDFTAVSVSSHLHFPIVQLSAAGIPAYLVKKKADGFKVVGIEQTDRSIILGSPDAKLPEKVVLLVGSEKEGIPAVVLTECDTLVEIPQKGITRSLNVQTAVGIVLYEHAKQHE